MNNQEIFNYTYSAKEQDEIRKIRNKYTNTVVEEDNMTKLRRLDESVTSKATVISLVIGVVGTLIMGFGMSLIMTDIGNALGTVGAMIVGILLGIIGLGIAGTAYPIYNRTVKKEREKIAPEIIRLTDELMK